MAKQTTVDTTMRRVPPVKGPTSTEPKQGEANQYYERPGVGKIPVQLEHPRSYDGTGITPGRIKKD